MKECSIAQATVQVERSVNEEMDYKPDDKLPIASGNHKLHNIARNSGMQQLKAIHHIAEFEKSFAEDPEVGGDIASCAHLKAVRHIAEHEGRLAEAFHYSSHVKS